MTGDGSGRIVMNEWTILASPLFLDNFERLLLQVASLREKHPLEYEAKIATKHLFAITKLIFTAIPQDPGRVEYRQGNTLGEEYRHWFRVKFFQQYRIFYRYHQADQVIIYGWVNDEQTKRAYGSTTDAFKIFRRMQARIECQRGNVPTFGGIEIAIFLRLHSFPVNGFRLVPVAATGAGRALRWRIGQMCLQPEHRHVGLIQCRWSSCGDGTFAMAI